MQVNIRIDGDKQTIAKLKQLGHSLNEFRSEFRTIGQNMTDFYSNKVFDSQGHALHGRTWQRLKPQTIRQKIKKYPGRGILEASGKLRRSFEFSSSIRHVTVENTARSSKGYRYGEAHMAGKRLPKREFMGINNTIKDDISMRIREGVEDRIRRHVR